MDGYTNLEEFLDFEQYLYGNDYEEKEEVTKTDYTGYRRTEDGFLTNDDNWKNGLGLI